MSDLVRLASPESEQAVLGAAIRFSRQAVPVLKTIGCGPQWFTSDFHRQMWETIEAKEAAALPVDGTLLETYIRERHGWDASDIIQRCVERCPDLTNLHAWGRVLTEMLQKRDLNNSILKGQSRLHSEATAAEIAIQVRNDLNQIGLNREAGGRSMILEAIRQDLDDESSADKTYVNSFLPWVHESIRGWYRGQPVVIGADPKTGKTTFLVQELISAAIRGHPRGLISLEMKARDVMYLAAGIVSGVDCFRLKTKQAHQEEKERFRQALKLIEDSPFYVVDSVTDTNQAMAAYYDLSLTHQCGVVGVDYFQLHRQPAGTGKKEKNRFEFFSEYSNNLVAAAKEIGNVLIMLSQLRKEGNMRGEKRGSDKDNQPTEHDLDGTGSLARDSHTCILMSKIREPQRPPPDLKNHTNIMFDIRLNRGGKTPEIPLILVRDQQSFISEEDFWKTNAEKPIYND